MSATIKGGADLSAFLASLPDNLDRNILRPALKAGAEVIADAARDGCRSAEVRATIKTSSKSEPGLVTAKVQTKGPGAYKAPWLENGTDPHFISVGSEASGGMTVRRVNRLDRKAAKEGGAGPGASLVIGGKFVGDTVHHPGAQPHAFMRPAVDTHEQQAIAAIGNHIATRLTKQGLATPPVAESEE